MANKKLFAGISAFSLVVGVVIGIVVSHIFRSSVDSAWNMVPGLNTIKANYGYAYY